MTANTCQCEHCKEIARQQERMRLWQKLKNRGYEPSVSSNNFSAISIL